MSLSDCCVVCRRLGPQQRGVEQEPAAGGHACAAGSKSLLGFLGRFLEYVPCNAVFAAGWGRNSAEVGKSPLREATRALLEGGLGRPLPFSEPPGNAGRFQVRLSTLFPWLATGGCNWA